METVIGIDLGTSTTEAAVYRNGNVEMIPNSDGSYVIPSAVGLDEEGNLIVGEKAKSRYILHPDRTAIEIKRNMGTKETIRLGNESYTAAELSAEILKVVRRNASEYLGEEVKRAVISVPAYFDDLQRRDVVKAGQLAGFVVERIINEPTAAVMSYGINHLEEESHILIYDLGGGTFDVTLLEMFDGVLEVKASSGDNRLGGKDFDACLIRFLKERFEEKNGVSLDGDVFAGARLKEQAEACKISLGTEEEVNFMSVIIPRNTTIPVTRYQTYYTSYDGQQAAQVEVYQGESRRASRNHLLGSFLLEGIPSAPAGKESLKISFSYDLNGMQRVEAQIVSIGKAADITVNMMEATEDREWMYRNGGRRRRLPQRREKSGKASEQMGSLYG